MAYRFHEKILLRYLCKYPELHLQTVLPARLSHKYTVSDGLQKTPVPFLYTEASKVFSGGLCLDSEEKLFQYLAYVKAGTDDPMSEKSQAFQEFCRLLNRAKEIIASMYQGDEEEKERGKVWKVSDISDSDVEKVICSGIPVNKMGNLKKNVSFYSGKAFQSEKVQQTADQQHYES